LSDNWRIDTPVDHERYKGHTPAVADPVVLTVEEEAQGLARRIRRSDGGEYQHNLGAIMSELRILQRNVAKGYADTSNLFRIAVLEKTLELLGVAW
jgi:hypothetical protein